MSTIDRVWAWIYPPLQKLRTESNEATETADRDVAWNGRRDRFLTELGLRDPSEHAVVDFFLRHLEALSPEQRAELLRSNDVDSLAYGFIQQCYPEQVAAPAPAYDRAAWEKYLRDNAWQWQGTAESWHDFRNWFAYYATAAGFQEPVTALLGELDNMSVTERIKAFGDLGVAIQAPTVEPAKPFVNPFASFARGATGGGTVTSGESPAFDRFKEPEKKPAPVDDEQDESGDFPADFDPERDAIDLANFKNGADYVDEWKNPEGKPTKRAFVQVVSANGRYQYCVGANVHPLPGNRWEPGHSYVLGWKKFQVQTSNAHLGQIIPLKLGGKKPGELR
ncbi:MAG TPA: hypothetical protein VHW44_10400 [Pseudonocardiaceae bacterium]|jgi:hypothetical protein|nr:hypothetical protein [Pseudonocardiaceae bacterium]